MKRTILIELVWLAGLFVFAYLLGALFVSNMALDIQTQDTYYSDGSKFTLWGLFVFGVFISAGFLTYLTRAILQRFKIVRVCIILIVFAFLILGVEEYHNYNFCKTFLSIYYTSSGPVRGGFFYGGDSSILRLLQALFWLKAFLILTVAFTSFMIGKWYKKIS